MPVVAAATLREYSRRNISGEGLLLYDYCRRAVAVRRDHATLDHDVYEADSRIFHFSDDTVDLRDDIV